MSGDALYYIPVIPLIIAKDTSEEITSRIYIYTDNGVYYTIEHDIKSLSIFPSYLQFLDLVQQLTEKGEWCLMKREGLDVDPLFEYYR